MLFFKKKEKAKSLVEFYELESWLNNTFSKEELKLIKATTPEIFDSKAPYNTDFPATVHLSNLLGFYNTKENNELCSKFVKRIESDINLLIPEDRYYAYIEIMKFYYKNGFIEEAERVINITLTFSKEALYGITHNELMSGTAPINPFYEQLAIIYKKRKEWSKVIELCEKGKAEGWSNDYDKRIEEAKKHL